MHPWLSSRGLEFSSPGLEGKGFLYDTMAPSDHKPIAKIFIKKWVFSPQRLADMFKDPVALKIVYAQVTPSSTENYERESVRLTFFLIRLKRT